MAEVPREIMNHLRAQMYSDRHAVPALQDSEKGEALDVTEQADTEPEGRVKKAFSRLALGSTEPELLGD